MSHTVVKAFRGGSLGSTELIRDESQNLFVRKSISAIQNREFGLVRWHSQMKRIQKYNSMFPSIFPNIINIGYLGNKYFMDLEYCAGFLNVKEFLMLNDHDSQVLENVVSSILKSASLIHGKFELESYSGSLSLYFQEECIAKFNEACSDKIFADFASKESFTFNGTAYSSLSKNIDWINSFYENLKPRNECLTHGNLTLENILIHPETLQIKFIDPYDENIVDCAEADLSQLLQCSNYHYGLLLDSDLTIDNGSITAKLNVPANFDKFNQILLLAIEKEKALLNPRLVDFFAFSQFLRMLPFKIKAGNTEQAILFYGLACKILSEMREKYGD
jgi:hypothetical protein